MVVYCEKCCKYYDDARRWTICPHGDLDLPCNFVTHQATVTTVTTDHGKVHVHYPVGLVANNLTDQETFQKSIAGMQDYHDNTPFFGSTKGVATLTADEIDFIRCMINKVLNAGPRNVQVEPEVWGPYKLRAQEIREKIRIGPPDERSKGL